MKYVSDCLRAALTGLRMIALFLMVATCHLNAQRADFRGLKFLTGVHVEILPYSGRTPSGVFEQQIKMDAELGLRQAGIRVLDMKRDLMPIGPFVAVSIKILELQPPWDKVIVFSLEILLQQPVYINRGEGEEQIYFNAATWTTSNIGLLSKDIPDGIRRQAREGIDEFINQYLAANPKEPG